MELCDGIVKECCIPEDWKSIIVVLPIYSGKGDPIGVWIGGIKLLEHAMKVVEKIFEYSSAAD